MGRRKKGKLEMDCRMKGVFCYRLEFIGRLLKGNIIIILVEKLGFFIFVLKFNLGFV